jgi:hypothetical protein
MPRSTPIPIGVPAGLPERPSERKTRVQSPAAFGVARFGARHPGPAEAWSEPEIWQWLIAKLPWGHPTRVLARVKGRPTRQEADGRANS